MEPNNSIEGFARSQAGICRFALALLACSWGATAFGASSLNIDCDRSANGYLSRSAASDELSVSMVDLTADDSTVGLERSIDDAVDADESIAPLLYLAPRVASILDDVFDEDKSAAGPIPATQKPSVAPMADSADEPAVKQHDVENSLIEVHPALMRIQREMYRTDI